MVTNCQGDGQADDADHGQDHGDDGQDVKHNGGRDRELATDHDGDDHDDDNRPGAEPGARRVMLRVGTFGWH